MITLHHLDAVATWLKLEFFIVCQKTEQEVPTKITQKIVLSFVWGVFGPLRIILSFTSGMRFWFKIIWAAMGKTWRNQKLAEHSNFSNDWFSDSRDIRTMSISRLCFENRCTNFRLRIFTDASEEAIWIVAYMQNETTLRLTYVIWKCRVAPIRHMTKPKQVLQAAILSSS